MNERLWLHHPVRLISQRYCNGESLEDRFRSPFSMLFTVFLSISLVWRRYTPSQYLMGAERFGYVVERTEFDGFNSFLGGVEWSGHDHHDVRGLYFISVSNSGRPFPHVDVRHHHVEELLLESIQCLIDGARGLDLEAFTFQDSLGDFQTFSSESRIRVRLAAPDSSSALGKGHEGVRDVLHDVGHSVGHFSRTPVS